MTADNFLFISIFFYALPKTLIVLAPAGAWCLWIRWLERKADRGEIVLPWREEQKLPTEWDLVLQNLRTASDA